MAVGLRTAEEIKRTVACALPREEDVTTYAKGQDLLTGLPREVEISGNALYLALQPYFETVAEHAGALFERTSPQLVTDIGNTAYRRRCQYLQYRSSVFGRTGRRAGA